MNTTTEPRSAGAMVSQISPQKETCSVCQAGIPAWSRYHRLAYDQDGRDPDGRDFCPKCSKASATKPAA